MRSQAPLSWRQVRAQVRRRMRGPALFAVSAGISMAAVAGRPGKGRLPDWHEVSQLFERVLGGAHAQAGGPEDAAAPAGVAAAAAGSVPERAPNVSTTRSVELSLASEDTGLTLPALLYLPPGYDSEPERRYPVLYMLHGLGGSYTQWRDVGLFDTATRLIEAGSLEPLIIVLPQGDQAYWMDHADNGPRWGRFVAHELTAAVDARFRTQPDRAHRAIGGMSMGGHGALQLAINNPDVFGVAGAHSLALRRRDIAPAYFGSQDWFNQHDPVFLYRERAAQARTLKLWVDIGKEDSWLSADEAFNRQLSADRVPHSFHVYPGGHTNEYWAAHAEEYLRFYGAGLSGQ